MGLNFSWTSQLTDSPKSDETFKVHFESCSFKLQYMFSCHNFFSAEVPVGKGIILHFHL